MPKIQCPQGHILSVRDEYSGKLVRCPECQTTLQVPEFAAALPTAEIVDDEALRGRMRIREADDTDDEYEAEHDEFGRRVTKKDRREALGRINTGLGLHIARISVIILGSLAIGIFAGVSVVQAGQRAGQEVRQGEAPQGMIQTMRTILLSTLILNVGAALLGIAGSALCVGVPRDFSGKGLIVGSLIADVVVLVTNVMSYLLSDPARQLRQKMIQQMDPLEISLSIISAVCWVASTVLFMLFLSNLAAYIKQKSLGEQAHSVLTLGVVAISLYLVGVAGAAIVPFLGLLAIVGSVCLLVWIIRYVRLLSAFRAALT